MQVSQSPWTTYALASKCLQAIRELPTSRNITDLRSWFGLLYHVSYAFSMAKRMLPFRQLLKRGNAFTWNDDLDNLFAESKEVIADEIEEGERIFDKPNPPALPPIGQTTGSASECSRNIARPQALSHFAAMTDGKSL